MQKYIDFEGQVELMEWGRSLHTILRIPDEVVTAIGPTRRVEGEINDFPVNLALTRAPVLTGIFVYTGKNLLTKAGIEPGQWIDIRFRAAPDDLVETPQDVIFALVSTGQSEAWEKLTPGKQRGHLHQIDTARTAPTRAKRIAALMALLAEGA